MSASTIYNTLCLAGMSPVGACAMLGNMMAESALRSNNAQDGMTSLSDEAYTASADFSSTSFVSDGVGYGLCQWTYYTRKQGLYNFAKQRGRSVGDEDTQVRFCIKELQEDFNALWQYLRKTDDIDTATDRICAEFERPAVNNVLTRRDHAKRYYAELVSGAYNPITQTGDKSSQANVPMSIREAYDMDEETVRQFEKVIQAALVGLHYDADNYYDKAVADYAADIKAGWWS